MGRMTGRNGLDREAGGPAAGFGRGAGSSLANAVAGGGEAYDRRRMLPRLIAIDPRDIEAGGAALDGLIEARLKRALRAERRRGRAGHWTYDLNRHIALLQALAGETSGRPPRDQAQAPVSLEGGLSGGKTQNAARRTGRRS